MDLTEEVNPSLLETPWRLESRIVFPKSKSHTKSHTLKSILLSELDILRQKVENDEMEGEEQQTIYEYINFCNGGTHAEDITEISKFYITGWWLHSLFEQKEGRDKIVESKN